MPKAPRSSGRKPKTAKTTPPPVPGAATSAFVIRGEVVGAERGDFVRAYDVDFRSEQLLGEAPIVNGAYVLTYSPERIAKAEQGTADVRVAVCETSGRELATSPVSFNVDPDIIINLRVVRNPDEDSEYTRYVAQLEAVMQGVTLAAVAAEPQPQQAKDTDFLTGETGIDRQHILWLIQAAALESRSRPPATMQEAASKAANANGAGIPAAAFYGWFREGLPEQWDALIAKPPATLRAALAAAVEHGTIPAWVGRSADRILDAVPNTRRDDLRQLGERSGLSPDTAAAVLRHAESGGVISNGVLHELVANGELTRREATSFGLAITIRQLVGEHLPSAGLLRTATIARLEGRSVGRPRDLAALDIAEVHRALADAGFTPPQGMTLDAAAEGVMRRIEQAFPNDVLLHRVADRPAGPNDQAAREYASLHPGLGLSELIDAGGNAGATLPQIEERVGWMRKVHAQNPDIDLLTIDYLPASDSLAQVNFDGLSDAARARVIANLKAYQRVQAVALEPTVGLAMLRANYASALAASRSTLEEFTANTNLPPETAAAAYAMAQAKTDEASIAFLGVHDLLRDAKNEHAFLFGPPAQLAELPGYDKLFGSIITCDCEHCQSVLSPSAYFVDLMQYVEKNILDPSFKTHGGTTHGLHLKSRRPDLWTLPLTCRNTDHIVPSLDIVNRILEAYIADKVPGVTAATLFEILATKDGSIRQPFVFPLERLAILLSHFEVDRFDIARLFVLKDAEADKLTRVRCRLSLPLAEYNVIVGTRLGVPPTTPSLNAAKDYYENQLGIARNLSTIPGDVETRYLDAIPMSLAVSVLGVAREAMLLVLQTDFVNGATTPAAQRVTIERGTAGGGVQNDSENIRQLTFGRLDRLERFVRLWRHTPWNAIELDYVLTRLQVVLPAVVAGAPSPRLDSSVLDALVELLELQEQWAEPVDTLCALWDGIPTKALRDEIPLLDRLFNQLNFVKTAADRWPQNTARFAFPELPGAGNPGTHARLLAALKVNDQELAALFAGLDPTNAGLLLTADNLALLYRHVELARVLRLSVRELFQTIALTPGVGASIDSLGDFQAVRATHDWRVASGYTLDEVLFIRDGSPILPGASAADSIAATLVAEVKADEALVFADTVFTQIGITDAQSRDVVRDNLSLTAADGKALERVPGTASYRLVTSWDASDAGAAFTFAPTGSDAMVAEAARGAYDIAKAGGTDGFARDAFTPLGMTATESGAFIDANIRGAADNKPLEAAPAGRYRVIAGVKADDAVASFQATSTAALRAAKASQLKSDARAILTRHHPTDIVLAKMSAVLQLPVGKVRALAGLAKAAAPAQATADAAAIADSLQGGNRLALDRLVARLSRLGVLFKNEAFDEGSLTFAGAARGVFGLAAAPADLMTAPLALDPEVARRASRYADAAKAPNLAFDPSATPPDRTALHTVLVAASLDTADPAILGRALRTDSAQALALQRQLQGQLATGLDGIRQLLRALEFAGRIGVSAETLALSVSDAFADLTRAADGIEGVFRARYPDDKTFQAKIEPYADKIRSRRRDGLVEYLVHPPRDVAGQMTRFDRSSDLYGFFLIDVLLEGCARTSELVSAMSSVQLYVHRVLMHLEQDDKTPPLVATLPSPARDEWSWRQHYRVWEANRKFFLFPENYVEPGIRDDKTPLFRELEDTLLQQQVTDQNVLDAYANYLRGLDELARLRVAGAYHDIPAAGDDILHLFGVTANDPPVYYYRTIRNVQSGNKTTFSPWQKVDLQIPAKKVSPLVFDSRLYVFWVETTTRPINDFAGGGTTFRGYRHSVRTKFTQLRLDGKWSAPQTLKVMLDHDGPTTDVRLVDDLVDNRVKFIGKTGNLLAGPMDVMDPNFGATLNLMMVLAAPPTSREFRITKVDPHVPFDTRNRLHPEALENYFPEGYRWDRTYPDTIDALSNKRFVTLFVPRTPGQTPLQEEIDVWASTATPLTGQSGETTLFAFTEQGFTHQFQMWGLNLPATRDAQIVGGSKDSRVYESGGEVVLAINASNVYRLWRLSSSLVAKIGDELAMRSFDGMLAADFQENLAEATSAFSIFDANYVTNVGMPVTPFEPRHSLGIYFRELFFQIPFLIADYLNSQQKFDLARFWYQYIFDPTAIDASTTDPRVRPWRYVEFRNVAKLNSYQKLRDVLTNAEQIEAYRKDPFNPHAIARLRAGAYQKAIVMKYIDNLLDWGDTLFTQFTMESVNEATMLYVMAADILGPRPAAVGPCGDDASARSYQDLATALRDGHEHDFLIEELELLQVKPPNYGGSGAFIVLGQGSGAVSVSQASTAAGPMPGGAMAAGGGGGAAPGAGDAASSAPNPVGWNQPSPTTWSMRGGMPLSEVYAGGAQSAGGLTVRGTDTGTPHLPLGGDPVEPPERKLPGFGGIGGNGSNGIKDIEAAGTVGMLDIRYGPRDIPLRERPHDGRVPAPRPSDVTAARAVFCIPRNTELFAYWDRVAQRLYNIRNCMDISGVRRSLDLFAPEIDPRMLMRMKAAGLSLDDVMNATAGNLPPYRFQYLIDKAKQHAGLVQTFGSQLLSALEKRDGEELARLRTVHEQNLLKMRTKMTQLEINAAEDTLESLRRQKTTIETRREHFATLSQTGVSPWERIEQATQAATTALNVTAGILHGFAAVSQLVPEVGAPTAMKFGGKQIGDSLYSWGTVASVAASLSEGLSRAAGLEATFHRRDEDWQHQIEVAVKESAQIDKHITAAEIRRDIAIQALDVHNRSVDQAQEVFEHLRDKFSSFGRYTLHATALQRLNRIAFNAALAMARLAEKAYLFERPDAAPGSLLSEQGYWEADNAGLLAGERLQLDLQQLERRFIETNYRTLEIEQSFSVAQMAPAELLRLREKGTCTFSIPESAFDLIYPGQYRRRIKAVRVSIPCVTGPHLNIGATLRLTGSRVRINPKLADTPVDVPLRHTAVIATSAAQNDAGVFEFSFRDERYMPFEGAGASSDWQLDLPATFRAFDYRTISDVILRINYVAEESAELRADVEKANATAERSLLVWLKNAGLPVSFSVRHDFPDAWRMLVTAPPNTVVPIEVGPRQLPAVLADWLRGRSAANAQLTFAPTAAPTMIGLVTDGAAAPVAPTASFTAWMGAATPPATPAPTPLNFTLGAEGLYTATIAATATLTATTGGTIRLRLNAPGNLAAAAGSGATLDESKLRDIVLLGTVRIS